MARTVSNITLRSLAQAGGRQSNGFTIVELLIVIVVIGILAAITIVAFNGVTKKANDASRDSELSQWRTKAEIHKIEKGIVCPKNYVFIYGNSTLGTSDFCVMKYEAKNNGGGVAVSQASGQPWTTISQTSAITVATTACDGCHLITSAEWMTIAADVLSVKYNWSGGGVGDGFIYSGHNDDSPASTLVGSIDNDGYFGTGNSATNGANQKRSLYLTSGDTIWDLAGNVWEWTNDTITGAQPGASGYAFREYLAITSWGNLPTADQPSSLTGTLGLGQLNSWTSAHGIGQIHSSSSASLTYAFRRGGARDNPSGAGVLSLALSSIPTYGGDEKIGFRVAR